MMLAPSMLWLWALLPLLAAGDDPSLYRDFQSPPARLRPFVRWWWNGGQVDEGEIRRELDVLDQAGVGGVEINTIAARPDSPPGGLPVVRWLSPAWCQAVKVAAEEARARRMTADLLIGSGWPFGGPGVPRGDQASRVRLIKLEVEGPGEVQKRLDALGVAPGTEARILFARLTGPGMPPPGQELGGRAPMRIPAGKHLLRMGVVETGYARVSNAAPGGEGPVLDHLNAAAVRRYLDRISTVLGPVLGGAMGHGRGGPLRAAFVDSLELAGANWTGDLPAEFARRRGYPLAPLLPFVLDPDAQDLPVRRARHDFAATLVELVDERFLQTTVAWAHDQGLLARLQAYGRETDAVAGSLRADLPEGESWLWPAGDRVLPLPTVVNKYVSSAAHLAGRTPVSFEAMTNTVPVFRETLEDFKLTLDASLLAGLQQPILHGFNLSPRAAGFPGLVRFGSWLHERAPFWPHLRRFTDYAARLTTVLTRSVPVAHLALVGADDWGRDGLPLYPFPELARPWYRHFLWEALQQAGFGSDLLSERILRAARVEGGRLRWGDRAYDTVILMELAALDPEAAGTLARFAAAGGRVVVIGRPPDRAPGAASGDERVRQAMTRSRLALAPAPEPGGPLGKDDGVATLPAHARRALLQWVLVQTTRLGLTPDLALVAPGHDVSVLHQRAGDRELYFAANLDRRDAADLVLRIPAGAGRPWRWDPETGARTPLATAGEALSIHLGPAETLLAITEPETLSVPAPAGAPSLPVRAVRAVRAIPGPWSVTLRPVVGPPLQRRLPQLVDLGLAGDPALAGFGGQAVYRVTFPWSDRKLTLLELGPVNGTSAVVLNGQSLGVRWYGDHLYDAGAALRPGLNRLEVTVTTALGNLMAARERQAGVQSWAWWFPPIPTGLLGPVQLVEPAAP
jgi:hypothetical protein